MSVWKGILHRARACAWCVNLTTLHGERCALDDGPISLERGTCGAWVLDTATVEEYSAHEKAAALVRKRATYEEELPQSPAL